MLRLSLEIPTAYLEEFSPLTDLDFVLAHKVLQDERYRNFYRYRKSGRELILDNSTHEFGTPMKMKELEDAFLLCKADVLIAPDVVTENGDDVQYHQNMIWLRETCMALEDYPLGSVLCGRSAEQRAQYVDLAYACDLKMLCFTFHESKRLQWWKDFTQHHTFLTWNRIHILGVSSLEEMKRWCEISEEHHGMNFSIDTTKPFKWGAKLRRIDDGESLRGAGGKDAQAVLEMENLSQDQLDCVKYNISVLRSICTGRC